MKKVEERFNFNLDLVEWLEDVGNYRDKTHCCVQGIYSTKVELKFEDSGDSIFHFVGYTFLYSILYSSKLSSIVSSIAIAAFKD